MWPEGIYRPPRFYYYECYAVITGIPGNPNCQSEAAAPGDIVSEPLVGKLGLVKGTEEVGLELGPETTKGTFAAFTCGSTNVSLRGAVIGVITPINKLVEPGEAFTVVYQQEGGKQAITKLEHGKKAVMEGSVSEEKKGKVKPGKYHAIGLETTEEFYPAEPAEIEVKAVPKK